jgi:hypothetical protein
VGTPSNLPAGEWLRTAEASAALGLSRDTLRRREVDGYLKAGQHFIATGPHRTSPRLWNVAEVRCAMAGWIGQAIAPMQEEVAASRSQGAA